MKLINLIGPARLMKILRFWPPFFAAGIRVLEVRKDMTYIKVCMVQRPWNTNYVGSHFGGSLYAMCDPFYMFMFLEHLKEDHIVWDKAASIEFVRPGTGTVYAEFKVTLADIAAVKKQAADGSKVQPQFAVDVVDSEGRVVAKVVKTLYIRKKRELRVSN